MPSPARRMATANPLPLLGHDGADAIAARRGGSTVAASEFLADVQRVAAALPQAGHVLNICSDRYRFAVVYCAAVLRGQVTLLPPTTTANVIAAMKGFAPDAYFIGDQADGTIDLPRHEIDWSASRAAASGDFDVPSIPGDRLVACVFTSGSTGEPQPNFKTWGSLVHDVRAEASRLGIGPGHGILGTVPAQHMYGFESTVMLPLVSGATLTAERLYYPADIDAAIQACPAPRTLFTTPFHLRAWLDSGERPAPIETILSATAPLSVGLARQAEERTGARLFEIYGCTESGQIATRRTSQSPEWQTLEGIRVWNSDGKAMVAGGHVEQPTPLQDILEVLGDGDRFILHGRLADVVNIAGKRNSLGYLNHQLTSIPGVSDGAFFLPDEEVDGVTRLMAFVVAPSLSMAQLMAALRERVDAAFMPRPLVRVESLPRQLTGKLPRESLQALAEAHRRKGAEA